MNGTVIVKLKHGESEAQLVVEFISSKATARIVNHSTDEIKITEVFQNLKAAL